MLCAAIDIHKRVFQAAVLEAETGDLVEARFAATRGALGAWAATWSGTLTEVAIEATCGWRWVHRELQARGLRVHLAQPPQTRALKGRKSQPKTDRLDARWLATLLAKTSTRERYVLTEEQAKAFLRAVENDPLPPAYLLAVHVGPGLAKSGASGGMQSISTRA